MDTFADKYYYYVARPRMLWVSLPTYSDYLYHIQLKCTYIDSISMWKVPGTIGNKCIYK